MSGDIDISCLGEPMKEFTRLKKASRKTPYPKFGGDTSNCAVAAARQGAKVATLPLSEMTASVLQQIFGEKKILTFWCLVCRLSNRNLFL